MPRGPKKIAGSMLLRLLIYLYDAHLPDPGHFVKLLIYGKSLESFKWDVPTPLVSCRVGVVIRVLLNLEYSSNVSRLTP